MGSEKTMPVNIDVTGEVVTARLDGELDHHTAAQIRSEIDSAIEKARPTLVIIDFRELTFMDSSGIGLVMGRYKKAREVGAELHITNTSPQIYKVMRLSGIERLAVIDKGGYKNETDK